jgi:hypothetical protein
MTRDKSKFAFFILTNGRPEKVRSYGSLRRSGYTGKVFFIVDNEDPTVDQYRENFGDENVIVFDKAKIAKTFDEADTVGDRRSIVYARNASFDIAKDLGLDYFCQLDDDYTNFSYRYIRGGIVTSHTIRNFDDVIPVMLNLLEDTNILTIAFSQGGDHFGGIDGNISKIVKRKAMNSFFVRTDRPINFVGRLNEDVNAYVVDGSRGELFFTTMNIQLSQVATQKTAGGMTETYLDGGTYLKSFFTVMMAPSCVKIRLMGRTEMRLHHNIQWDKAVPKIISDKYRKTK